MCMARNILAYTVTTFVFHLFTYPVAYSCSLNNVSLYEAYASCGSHGVILTITMYVLVEPIITVILAVTMIVKLGNNRQV